MFLTRAAFGLTSDLWPLLSGLTLRTRGRSLRRRARSIIPSWRNTSPCPSRRRRVFCRRWVDRDALVVAVQRLWVRSPTQCRECKPRQTAPSSYCIRVRQASLQSLWTNESPHQHLSNRRISETKVLCCRRSFRQSSADWSKPMLFTVADVVLKPGETASLLWPSRPLTTWS